MCGVLSRAGMARSWTRCSRQWRWLLALHVQSEAWTRCSEVAGGVEARKMTTMGCWWKREGGCTSEADGRRREARCAGDGGRGREEADASRGGGAVLVANGELGASGDGGVARKAMEVEDGDGGWSGLACR